MKMYLSLLAILALVFQPALLLAEEGKPAAKEEAKTALPPAVSDTSVTEKAEKGVDTEEALDEATDTEEDEWDFKDEDYAEDEEEGKGGLKEEEKSKIPPAVSETKVVPAESSTKTN